MHKIFIFFISSLVMLACQLKQPQKSYPFYLGTYTGVESKGIYKGVLNSDGTFEDIHLVAETENPSFLSFAHNKQVLLAVNEVDNDGAGTIQSFNIKGDTLNIAGQASTGGAHPCHLNANKDGDALVANYTGGNIGLLKVSNSGELSTLLSVNQHEGSGPTQRQLSPHAHSVWFTRNGDKAIAVDLGTDELIFYNIESQKDSGSLVQTGKLALEAGSGPRHLTFHPTKNILYVVNELNSTISVVKQLNDSEWELLTSISTLPDDFDSKSFCADIHISPDGKFLYASNRGHNSIAIFSADESGEAFTAIAYESVRGDWPRNFSLTPDGKFLIVANQRSNNLVAFKRDSESGLLNFVSEIEAPTPVCVLFK